MRRNDPYRNTPVTTGLGGLLRSLVHGVIVMGFIFFMMIYALGGA